MTMIDRVRDRTVRGGTERADFSLGTWTSEDMQGNALAAAGFMREVIRSVASARLNFELRRQPFGAFEVAVWFDAGDEKAWDDARRAEARADAIRPGFGKKGRSQGRKPST